MTEPVPEDTALRLQLVMIAGREPKSSCFEIRPRNREGAVTDRKFVRVSGINRCIAEIQHRRELDVFIGCSPRTSYTSGTLNDVQRSWCLRADCDDEKSAACLRTFTPRPSLVVRSGGPGRLQAWWQLSEPLSNEYVDRANRRIALALGSDTAVCHAAAVMRAICTVNHKYPAPVECFYLDPRSYDLAEVVGDLPDDVRYQPPSLERQAAKRRVEGKTGGKTGGLIATVANTPEGNRNAALHWAACRAAEEGTLGETHDELLGAAIEAGLTEREALATLHSAARWAA